MATITPSSVVAGSAAQLFTVTGTGFVASSVLNVNGTALATTFVSATSLTATLPASAIASDGSVTITVTNPAPGGGSSAVQNYTVTVPTPAATALSPQVVPQAAAAKITVTGTGFEAKSVAQWNGAARPTTFVNATTLEVALTAADVQGFGTGQITIINPGVSPTTPLDLLVMATAPTITYVSPGSVAAGSTAEIPQQIYISGSGFAANATVQANGAPATVVSQSGTLVTVSLPASDFTTPGTISLVVTNPGSPAVSSNAAVLTVTAASAATLSIQPNSAAAGSPDTTITVFGSNFTQNSVVQWNSTTLATSYVGPTQLTAVIPAELIAGFVQAEIGVSTPEDATQPTAQPFDTYLDLPVNDIVYNAVDGYIYASIPGWAGENLGNTIAAIDPTTGVVMKTIAVGSEPNRLALSTDGTQLFVGLDGAGAVRQVNLTTDAAGVQFPLGGGPGVYNAPYTAAGLAAVQGQPNSVAVYGTNGVVSIYDAGVARANTSSGLETYFTSNIGGLAFGSSASTLYVMSNAIGGYLYQLTVDSTGITTSKQIGTGTGGNTLQYDNGLLYVPTGLVFNAASGAQAGQFSIASSYSTTPTAAQGPVFSDSTLHRAWILPTSGLVNTGQILSFDETTYDPLGSIPVTGIGANSTNGLVNPADLIRWGQDGLAFHTLTQLYVVRGPIVKDTTGSPADVSISIQAAATATTGTALSYTVTVQNAGPSAAQGVTVTSALPQGLIFNSVQASQGSCSGNDGFYCDLGSVASGGSAIITVNVTPATAATVQITAQAASVSYDPVSGNNQATATMAVTGGSYNPAPVITQLVPSLVGAGSGSFVLTVDGEGFSTDSTINWNGTALPTTLLSSGQLTANVDGAKIGNLGWAQISVSSPAPGGGQSGALTLSVYQLLNVPANAMAFDPFSRKLYAVLPSTATTMTGNSVVEIDPATGTVGAPIVVGSEPNVLSETSDGRYFYIGLSGAKALGRFNVQTQAVDLTVSLPASVTYSTGTLAAMAVATVPGSDSSLAVEEESFDGIGILDIAGSTGTFRAKSGSAYSGDYPIFVDATHFYAYDATTTGAEFYRYTVDANGAELVDGTTLDGMGGFGGRIAVDGGLVYGAGGGIIDPSTTPPSQVAVLPLSQGPAGTTLYGAEAIPYAAEAKSFNVALNGVGGAGYLERFDTQHYTLEDELTLPAISVGSVTGIRWGQDGLALLMSPPSGTSGQASQILLMRGPWVLPAEASSNPAPMLTAAGSGTIAAGSGNQMLSVTGSGFLPGATVLWNGSGRTTTFVDSQHLTVAIAAGDVQSAASNTITCQNPGSGASNSVTVTVQ